MKMKCTPCTGTLLLLLLSLTVSCNQSKTDTAKKKALAIKAKAKAKPLATTIDTVDYKERMLALANGDTTKRWPTKAPYPLNGALLPYNRIIAFYGNLYSKRMGILGQIPKAEMLKKLKEETDLWRAADTTVTTIPALHYIAISAQGKPGKDSLYRMRMPLKQIDTVISWARPIKALVFLDVQVGHSNVKDEIETLKSYMEQPDVHLGIDPEFSMKTGAIPSTKIGTFDATDINIAVDFLAAIVREKKLPPKILIVHRFTQGMVTNYDKIKKVPEVQVIMDMDGFGAKYLKRSTYFRYIYKEPVQFTGFKLFYKNDVKADPNGMLTREEVLALKPKPIYIQYQ